MIFLNFYCANKLPKYTFNLIQWRFHRPQFSGKRLSLRKSQQNLVFPHEISQSIQKKMGDNLGDKRCSKSRFSVLKWIFRGFYSIIAFIERMILMRYFYHCTLYSVFFIYCSCNYPLTSKLSYCKLHMNIPIVALLPLPISWCLFRKMLTWQNYCRKNAEKEKSRSLKISPIKSYKIIYKGFHIVRGFFS